MAMEHKRTKARANPSYDPKKYPPVNIYATSFSKKPYIPLERIEPKPLYTYHDATLGVDVKRLRPTGPWKNPRPVDMPDHIEFLNRAGKGHLIPRLFTSPSRFVATIIHRDWRSRVRSWRW